MGRRSGRKRRAFIAVGATIATVALFAAVAQSRSVKPESGSWAGSVGPFAVHFTVGAGGSEITNLGTSFNPAADCGVPTNEIHVHFPPMPIQAGHFHGTTSSGSGETAWHYAIDGAFTSPKEVSGTVSGHFRTAHNALPPCHASGPLKATPQGR